MNIFSKFFKWLFNTKKSQSVILSASDTGTTDYPVIIGPPTIAPCLCHTVYGLNGELGPSYSVSYVNCVGKTVETVVNPGQKIRFCAKSGSVKTYAFYDCTKCTPECMGVSISPNIGSSDITMW